MDERFPRVFLVIIGIITVLIMIVGAIGLWEDGGPVILPRDHMDRLEDEGRTEPTRAGDTAPVAPATTGRDTAGRDTAGRDTPPRTAPDAVELVAILKRVETDRPTTPERPVVVAKLKPGLALPPLPEVQGRFQVHTRPEDGAVREVQVDHGAPLAFTVTPGAPGEPTTVSYRGRGLHARIVTLVTASGARLTRRFTPRTPGAAHRPIRITAPGTLTGTVVDERDRPLVGAIVTSADTTAATDGQGRFTLTGVRGQPVLIYVTARGYAPQRVLVETAPGFGTPRGPDTVTARVRLRSGVRLTVDAHLPNHKTIPAPGFTFYLIPFAHRLAATNLATEKLGPYRVTTQGPVVVEGVPRGVELVLVGIHPEMNVIHRRLEADTADVRLTIMARRRPELTGVVQRADTGRRIERYELTTSLDNATVGTLLGGLRKIPTGHEPGTFPLPTIDAPIVEHRTDDQGRFHIRLEESVRKQLALRFAASGLHPKVIEHVGVARELTVKLTAPDQVQPVETGRVALTVNLAGAPPIRAFTFEGIEEGTGRVVEPGHAEATIADLPLGQYEITVRARGYEPYTRTIHLSSGSTRRMRFFLSQK